MSGQAANMTREEVRSKIRSVEKNCSGSKKGGMKMSKESMKTVNKK